MHPLLPRLSFLVASVAVLSFKFNSIVPDPYLDEVFHVPQSQRYCAGKWTEWDDKITTPFGLYVISWIYTRLLSPVFPSSAEVCSTVALRSLNGLGVAIVLPLLAYRIARKRGRSQDEAANDAVSIGGFPLIFFFAGLFYTDVWSTVFLLAAYERVLAVKGWESALLSGISILFRQTNVLWTAFFCVIHVLNCLKQVEPLYFQKKGMGEVKTEGLTWIQRLQAAWDTGLIYNPPLAGSDISDIISSVITLILAALRSPAIAMTAAAPFFSVIFGFVAFVIWNGGIVLGDKSAHTATIHVPQLLYYFLFTLFISWPLLIDHTLPLRFLRTNFPILCSHSNPKFPSTTTRLFRTTISIAVLAGMAFAVHKNTVLHPYLLADNRHYPFYLFRRSILRYPLAKYLAVPIYFGGGWAMLDALSRARSRRKVGSGVNVGMGVGVIWIVAYLLAFTASVIGAGLVEFRYFVPGWVLWRVTVGSQYQWRWLVEIVWFGVVNWVTAALFLYRGFEWQNEPGKVQRFMW